jgi:hypothetical protein
MAMAVNLTIISKNCYMAGGSIWPGEGLSHGSRELSGELSSDFTLSDPNNVFFQVRN